MPKAECRMAKERQDCESEKRNRGNGISEIEGKGAQGSAE
jgi:hypothetical protein